MKITNLIRDKGGMFLIVVAIMLCLWGFQRWLLAKKSPEMVDLKQYQSTQIRRLPCGRFQKHVVELEGPTGVKIVQILNADGSLMKEKREPVDLEHCVAIENGIFVPDLWKDCILEP